MVPGTSPAGVDKVIVPTIDLDVSFASVARPPSAARYFSLTSSAVWAEARRAQPRMIAAAKSCLGAIFICVVSYGRNRGRPRHRWLISAPSSHDSATTESALYG